MAVLSEEPSLPPLMQDAVQQLIALAEAATTSKSEPTSWTDVACAGKTLADGLRSEGLRTALGQTAFVSAVAALLRRATCTEGGGVEALSARTELARVVGNLCFDHDANRRQVLDADIPLLLAQLLERTLRMLPEGAELPVGGQEELSIDELKFVRATTGAFLNSSLKFDAMRRYLSRREIVTPLLALLDARTTACKSTAPIYIVGCWTSQPEEGEDAAEREERMQIGQMAVGWAANVLEDALGENKADFPPTGVLSLASVVLSTMSSSTSSSLPPSLSPEDASDYLDTNIELLTICSSLLESLTQDLPSIASTLAFSTYNPSVLYPSSTLLSHLLHFISDAAPPPHWAVAAADDPARAEKAFATVKAAVVRAVVEAPNDDAVMERLWHETRAEGEGAKSWLVEMMVRWLGEARESGREDMLIAAAHLLAGLGRKDEHTLALVHDYALAAPLARIVHERVEGAIGRTGRPGETTQILFGVVSLLRHLAIPVDNRQIIGETGVIAPVAQLLRRELDIVQPLQLAVIGLLKHLVAGNVPNALAVLGLSPSSSPTAPDSPTAAPLGELVALISRADELRLRSEGTRILVHLVRALFSLPSCASSHADGFAPLVAQGRERIATREVVDALAELVRLGGKFPILVNEGVVGLTLLAGSGDEGASLVLTALLHPPARPPPPAPAPHPLDPSAAPGSLSTLPAALQPAPPAGVEAPPPSAAAMLAQGFALAPTLAQSQHDATALLRPEMLGNAAALVRAVSRAPVERAQRDALRSVLGDVVRAAGDALDGEVGESVRRAGEVLEGV